MTFNQGVAMFTGLSYDMAETMNISFSTSTGSFSATSSGIAVGAGSASQLVFGQQPTSTSAGDAISPAVTVKIEDQFGNVVTADNTDQVTLGIASGPGTFSGSNTVAATASAGVAAFSDLVLDTAGTYSLSETATGNLSGSSSNSFAVTPNAASKRLAITTEPSSAATAGVNFGTQPVVKEEDAFGNVFTSDSSSTVTAATGTEGSAALQGSNLTVTLSQGVATFAGLSYDKAETMNITFSTSAGSFTATSGSVNVSPNTAANQLQLVIVQQPSATSTAGIVFGTQPVVKEEDAFGNTITSDSSSTVTAARGANGTAALQGANLTVTLNQGVATFSGLSYDKAETMNILFTTSASDFSVASSSIIVSPNVASQLGFGQEPTSTTVGVTINPVVRVFVEDSFGNVITTNSSSVTISFGSNPGGAALSGTTVVAAVDGVATFSNLSVSKVGVGYTLAASDGTFNNCTSGAFNIVVLGGLPAPTPISPIGTIAVSSGFDLPTFTWSSVAAAENYTVYLIDNTLKQALFGGTVNVAGTTWTPTTALTPGHSYTWYAGAANNVGTDFWSTGQTFSLAALAAPAPVGPSGTISVSSGFDLPTFSWSSVTAASHYTFYIVDTTLEQALFGGIVNVAGTSWTPTSALTPGHSYSWYAGAASENGTDFWSTGQALALAALSAPAQIGPSGTSAASSGFDLPTFTWTGVTAADHYTFYIVDTTLKQALFGGIVNVVGTTWTPTTVLTPGHNYTWYAGAASSNDQEEVWSGGKSFSLAPLVSPALSGPAGSVAVSTGFDLPSFAWSSEPGADQYAFYLFDNTMNHALNGGIVNVSATSFAATTPLTPGDSYTWFAGAANSNDLAVSWSTGQSFTLAALPAPTLSSSMSGTIPVSVGYDLPIFSWSSVTDAASYSLYLVDNSANQVLDGGIVNVTGGAAGTTWVPSAALTPGHYYTWYVASVSNSGKEFWSPGQLFYLSALPAPTQIGPSGTIPVYSGYDMPQFAWNSVTDAASYTLYLVDSSTNQVLEGGVVNVAGGAAGTTWVPTAALTPGNYYTWYAGSVSNSGKDYWSAGQTFYLAPLPAPTLGGPSGSIPAGPGNDLPTFSWASVTDAARYTFYLYDDSTNQALYGGVVNVAGGVNGTTWIPASALTAGQTYTWYVGAVSDNGTTFWSTGSVFTLAIE